MRYEEKQLKSECVYDGRIMTVQRDDVELATGQKSFREVVRHSGGVVVLALKDEETILMVKQFRYPIAQTVWDVPAGKLENSRGLLPSAGRLKKSIFRRTTIERK